MTAAISVRGVTKVFNEGANRVPVLHAVDLDVANGELVLLMGPSGSGKTTLLSIMGCILRATSGSVRILGIEVAHLSERDLPGIRLRHIGFVFQGFNLFPTLTVGENVELTLDLKGVRGLQAKKEARQLLEQVGLADKYATFPSALSGGQKQRVAIARALAGSAEIILADEPTAALDGHTGRIVMQMMHDLAHKHGRGVVVVTHDSRVLEFADRIVRMEDGRIIPADRGHTALVATGTVLENFMLDHRGGHGSWGLRHARRERQITEAAVRRYEISCTGIDASITSLSGGNQQKLIMARCLEASPALLVLHEPTQGVDVRARADLLAHMHRAVGQQSLGVLYVSGDFDEVWNNAHRVVVVRRGRQVGEADVNRVAKDSVHHLLY